MYTFTRLLNSDRKILGAAVGSGVAAMATETGEVDLIMALTAGIYRTQGCSSLAALMPYASANQQVLDLTYNQIMPRLHQTPLFVGLCAQDPLFDFPKNFLEFKQHGICGVTNFPSVGFIDGNYRNSLQQVGLGLDREMAMLIQARTAGLHTIGFCFNAQEALTMADAQVDLLCLNLGFAQWRKTSRREHQAALDQCIENIGQVTDHVHAHHGNTRVVVFGGPILLPQDLACVYEHTNIHGYIGGSTIERQPAERTISQTVQSFKMLDARDSGQTRFGSMLGLPEPMQRLFDWIRKAAQSDASVLLMGESGTGKELAAREIHRMSPRRHQPFVAWNCGATTENLAMSELFGHEKGAFTGAHEQHIGRFEIANGATLFMDEVADLPLSVQAGLLRTLQERQIVRVGGTQTIPVDVRLISATNQDFRQLIPEGRFRFDLYYRLNTLVLNVPPLRQRRDDISLLIHELMLEFSERYACSAPAMPDEMIDALTQYNWPGNIRELRTVIERIFVLGQGDIPQMAWFDDLLNFNPSQPPSHIRLVPHKVNRQRRAVDTLNAFDGNKAAAARHLGITRKTLYAWLKEI